MFGHKTIEDIIFFKNQFLKHGHEINNKINQNYFDDLIIGIKNSIHFHLGNANFLDDEILKHSKMQELFTKKLAIDINLPYNQCWFDFFWNKHEGVDAEHISTKGGFYIKKLDLEKTVYYLIPAYYQDVIKRWFIGNNVYFIVINGVINDVEFTKKMSENTLSKLPSQLKFLCNIFDFNNTRHVLADKTVVVEKENIDDFIKGNQEDIREINC